jgi:predicted PurR-regulated permease PerM
VAGVIGLQTPLLLGLLSAVLSLVPVVGAFLIWGPLVLFLLLQHEFATALGLSLWGILIIHPADNIFRPWVIGTMLHSPLLLIVLGVVGGILSMGLIGLFVGPCILSLLYHGWCDWASKAH